MPGCGGIEGFIRVWDYTVVVKSKSEVRETIGQITPNYIHLQVIFHVILFRLKTCFLLSSQMSFKGGFDVAEPITIA